MKIERFLRDAEPKLGIDVDIVVPGEDISGCQLRLRQAHHLGKIGPGTAIEVRHPLGCDDWHALRTLYYHWAAVQPGITDSFAFIWCKSIAASQYSIDRYRHICIYVSHI